MAVKLRVDSEYSDRGLKKARSDVASFSKYTSGMFKRLGATIAGFFAFNQIRRFITSSISAFMDEERATKSLAQALEISGQSADEFLPKLTSVAAALQTVAKVEDDVIINSMSLGSTLGIAAGNLDDAAAAAVALNKKFGVDMEKGMRLVGNALAGNTAGLARYFKGLTGVKDVTDAYNIIAATTSNILREQAGLASTNAEKAVAIKIAFGELQEQFGAFLMNSAGVSSILDEVLFAMEQIQATGFGAWFEEQFPSIDGFIERISSAGSKVDELLIKLGIIKDFVQGTSPISMMTDPSGSSEALKRTLIRLGLGEPVPTTEQAGLIPLDSNMQGPPAPTPAMAKEAFINTKRREREVRIQDALDQIRKAFSGREEMKTQKAPGGQALSVGDLFQRVFEKAKGELGTAQNPMNVLVLNGEEVGGLGE